MSPPQEKPTLLVVDDEDDIRHSLGEILESSIPGAEVKIASSGAAALEILRENPVDVIVTDYRMPEMNGLDFLARARAIAPRTSAIMITAYPDPEIARHARHDLGVRDYFLKPLNPTALVGAVRGALRDG